MSEKTEREMTPALLEHLTADEREAWRRKEAADGCGFGTEAGIDYIATACSRLPSALLALAEARKELTELRSADAGKTRSCELCAQLMKERDEERRIKEAAYLALADAISERDKAREGTASLTRVANELDESNEALRKERHAAAQAGKE